MSQSTHPRHLWLIEPVAEPADPRWQDRTIWRKVVVAAGSAAFAREIAESWALNTARNQLGITGQIGNESPSQCAGFSDVKLYAVKEVPTESLGILDPNEPSEGVILAEPLSATEQRQDLVQDQA
ncbi:hypothetical protein ACFPL7_11750 [Dongia soli]|uniref:Uncharacterized protein n=1 Tax=Dongia soli TaxID=600628 RepID=A0ABU5EJI0_9PROT|nr:hypothetical protein [Dongia soli]MDY0885515.1 hypothetical protein [Dongia soli]